MKVKVLNILWYVCKQTFNESCIKSYILMKFEYGIALRCIKEAFLYNGKCLRNNLSLKLQIVRQIIDQLIDVNSVRYTTGYGYG